VVLEIWRYGDGHQTAHSPSPRITW
jgi:hypothetical protein